MRASGGIYKTPDLPATAEKVLSADAAGAAPLLLLLARERLDEAQADLARQLAKDLPDWQPLASLAWAKLCLPFVHHHVAALDLLPHDMPLRQAMHMATVQQAARWLKLAAEQRRFLETCLAPVEIPHVFVKGVSLARYYAEPGLRTCRDIDVLVDEAGIDPVIEAAQAAGYRAMLDVHRGRFAVSARDVRAIRRYKKDVPLLSPGGILIEVHTALDDTGQQIFDTADVLARAETAEVAGTPYRCMPTTDLAVYLAYHHNKHIWSSLHWLGDMGAIMRHPSWSADAVKARADEFGLSEALEATLAFDRLAGRPDLWVDASEGPARESLELCLQTLECDREAVQAVKREHIKWATNWRWPERERRRAVRGAWKKRFTPRLNQYMAFPLPDWLQWIYPLGSAIRAVQRRIKGERRRKMPPSSARRIREDSYE